MSRARFLWNALLGLLGLALLWSFLVHAYSDHVDYNTYHWAGASILQGRFDTLYSPERASMGGFLYPLVSAWFFAPFAALGEGAGRWCFYGLLAACLVSALRWAAREFGPHPRWTLPALTLTLLLSVRSVNDSFISGNINLLLLGLGIVAFRYRERRPVLAEGALALAMSFKIFPALLTVLWLGERRWRSLVRMGLFTAGLYLLPYFALGWERGWSLLHAWLLTLQSPGNFGGSGSLMFQNLPAAFHRLAWGLGIAHAWVLPVTALIGIAVALVSADRGRPADRYAVLLAWVPLLSPVTWYGLGVFYIPLLFRSTAQALQAPTLQGWLGLVAFFTLYTAMGKDVIGGPAFDWVSAHSLPLLGVLAWVLPATARLRHIFSSGPEHSGL